MISNDLVKMLALALAALTLAYTIATLEFLERSDSDSAYSQYYEEVSTRLLTEAEFQELRRREAQSIAELDQKNLQQPIPTLDRKAALVIGCALALMMLLGYKIRFGLVRIRWTASIAVFLIFNALAGMFLASLYTGAYLVGIFLQVARSRRSQA